MGGRYPWRPEVPGTGRPDRIGARCPAGSASEAVQSRVTATRRGTNARRPAPRPGKRRGKNAASLSLAGTSWSGQAAVGSNRAKNGRHTRSGRRHWRSCRTNTSRPSTSERPRMWTLPGVSDMLGLRTVRARPETRAGIAEDLVAAGERQLDVSPRAGVPLDEHAVRHAAETHGLVPEGAPGAGIVVDMADARPLQPDHRAGLASPPAITRRKSPSRSSASGSVTNRCGRSASGLVPIRIVCT